MVVFPLAVPARPVIVKLGTVAPQGSAWHDALLEIRQGWRDASDGQVELRIYPGGVLGGETEMLRKIQRGGLDAVTISASGLTFVDKSLDCLALPLLIGSYEELDYIRDSVTPTLERVLETRKLKLLSWAEAGWLYFFSRAPIRTPSDLRRQRLWTSPGTPHVESLFRDFGFKPVPLPANEMLTGLQTGLIDAIDVPPLFALLDGSYRVANHMTDVKWAPLNAAFLISTTSWERIQAQYRQELSEIAKAVARRLRSVNRQAEQEAIAEMQARGLKVVTLSPEELAVWHEEAAREYPKLRGTYVDAALFDEVMRLHESFGKRQ